MEGKSIPPDLTSETNVTRNSIILYYGQRYTSISRPYEKVGDAGCLTLERDFTEATVISLKIANNIRYRIWDGRGCAPQSGSEFKDSQPWILSLNYPIARPGIGVREVKSFECDALT